LTRGPSRLGGNREEAESAPIIAPKGTGAPSLFQPENLIREGRRQLGRTNDPAPDVCLLDPDGDVVRYLRRTDAATLHPGWACYHTELWASEHDGQDASSQDPRAAPD
jgi:hypothetical protein